MTISEIRETLSQINVQRLQLKGEANALTDLPIFRAEILKLSGIPGVEELRADILNSVIFANDYDAFNTTQAPALRSMSFVLAERIRGARAVAEAQALESSPLIVRVRMPDTDDLGVVSVDQRTLKTAIEQLIVNETIQGELRLVGWENGSLWQSIALGTPAAVAIVGAAVWAAAVVRKKRREGDILEEQVRGMKIRNDVSEALGERVKELSKEVVEVESMALYEKFFSKEPAGEDFERVKESIRLFAELISRGAEVHPSLMAPETADNVFPNFSALDSITSKIRTLKENAEK